MACQNEHKPDSNNQSIKVFSRTQQLACTRACAASGLLVKMKRMLSCGSLRSGVRVHFKLHRCDVTAWG